MANAWRTLQDYIGQHGVSYTLQRAIEKGMERAFHPSDRRWQQLRTSEDELNAQRANDPGDVGGISICIPVYNTRPDLLQALADSLLAQTCGRWEACLYDGRSTNPETIATLKKIADSDARFHVLLGEENDGISGNTNRALAMATGRWITLLDHDDLLAPDTIWRVTDAIQRENPDMLYSDEDRITEDGRYHLEPHYKPDFSPDNLRCGNYICHLMVIRKTLVDEVGGLRPAFDGSQDHDLALRCSERATKVVHLPYILYHWRVVGTSMSHQQLDRCLDAGRRAITEQTERLGIPAEVVVEHRMLRPKYRIEGHPTVNIILIDCGDEQLWLQQAKTLSRLHTDDVRITVVSPQRDAADDFPGSRYVAWDPAESVFAAMNRAAEIAKEELLCFLHGSVLMKGDDWVQELIPLALQPGIGTVSPVVLDERRRVLHAGFAVEMKNTVQPLHAGLPGHSGGYHSSMWQLRDVTAVSAAAMMIRRDRFLPFDETFRGGCAAVDLCLRLPDLRQVVTPFAVASCRDHLAASWLMLNGKQEDAADRKLLQQKHPDMKEKYYPHVFNREKADYTFRKG